MTEHKVTHRHIELIYVQWVHYKTHNVFCQNKQLQTAKIQIVDVVQYTQQYCETQRVVVRTHIYTPSQCNLLCTFILQNNTVTQIVLRSGNTF